MNERVLLNTARNYKGHYAKTNPFSNSNRINAPTLTLTQTLAVFRNSFLCILLQHLWRHSLVVPSLFVALKSLAVMSGTVNEQIWYSVQPSFSAIIKKNKELFTAKAQLTTIITRKGTNQQRRITRVFLNVGRGQCRMNQARGLKQIDTMIQARIQDFFLRGFQLFNRCWWTEIRVEGSQKIVDNMLVFESQNEKSLRSKNWLVWQSGRRGCGGEDPAAEKSL